MGARMTGLGGAGGCRVYTMSEWTVRGQAEWRRGRRRGPRDTTRLTTTLPSCSPRLVYSPPYTAVGGYRREEGIMLLRRFYISENTTGSQLRPAPIVRSSNARGPQTDPSLLSLHPFVQPPSRRIRRTGRSRPRSLTSPPTRSALPPPLTKPPQVQRRRRRRRRSHRHEKRAGTIDGGMSTLVGGRVDSVRAPVRQGAAWRSAMPSRFRPPRFDRYSR